MIIIFYRVGNSQNFKPRHFVDMFRQEIIDELKKLKSDEYRVYDMSCYNGGDMPNAAHFVMDFNDSLIDNTWYCLLLPVL